jgi:hypothetical protein
MTIVTKEEQDMASLPTLSDGIALTHLISNVEWSAADHMRHVAGPAQVRRQLPLFVSVDRSHQAVG